MSNIEDDVKIVKEFIDYAQEVIDDMEYERPVDVTVYQKYLTSMQSILAEREQDKKRIKELEEERNHWHGCFIVAMENSIAKEKVIEAFEDIEDYFDRLNGPDEDMDYIRQVKQELLEGEK